MRQVLKLINSSDTLTLFVYTLAGNMLTSAVHANVIYYAIIKLTMVVQLY